MLHGYACPARFSEGRERSSRSRLQPSAPRYRKARASRPQLAKMAPRWRHALCRPQYRRRLPQMRRLPSPVPCSVQDMVGALVVETSTDREQRPAIGPHGSGGLMSLERVSVAPNLEEGHVIGAAALLQNLIADIAGLGAARLEGRLGRRESFFELRWDDVDMGQDGDGVAAEALEGGLHPRQID